jgi:urea transporter
MLGSFILIVIVFGTIGPTTAAAVASPISVLLGDFIHVAPQIAAQGYAFEGVPVEHPTNQTH